MRRVKSLLCFCSRNHRSGTESLHLNSTTTQAVGADAARTSSDDSGQMPPETDSPVEESTIVASKTPLWDQAISEFQEKCKAEYEELKLPAGKAEYEALGHSRDGIEFEQSILNKKLPDAFQEEAGHSNHAIMRRLKSWLPALGAAKGLAMALARLDPHQFAPYIVAGSFFAVEILLQIIPADQKEATLEVVCDSVIIMLKWRSYEENLLPNHRSISDETAANAVQRLIGSLPDLYATALKLQARIRADTRSRKEFSVRALLGSVDAWKADLTDLKRKDRDCVATKDIIKDCLDRQDHHSKVLKWIKKEGAPDPHHEEIKKKTGMDQDAYRQAGRWFVESDCFKNWMTPGTGQPTGNVVWLKGTMGTGKSTLVCQAISRFSEEQDGRPPGHLRVAYYYCSASATGATVSNPDKEVVLRSLCRKLAWQENETIAECAITFHAKYSKENAEPADWGELLRLLLDASASPVILVIDALDECSKEEELLKYLADSVQSRSNVYLLCSSRAHVLVATYFHAAPAEIDTISGKKEADMGVFITTTMDERIRSPETQESIFRGADGTALLDDLGRALKKGADGMFRWVEIWFSILFPPNPRNQIIESPDARDLIDQIAKSESIFLDSSHAKLTVAYNTLWEINSRVRHKVLQPRLFHLVLCAFDDLSLNQLTDALRIDPEGKKPYIYNTELQPMHVEWLCHNFLVTNSAAGLEWAHQSAKDFVTQQMIEGDTPVFSEASNHIYMSQIALQLMTSIHHPAWKAAGLDLSYWRKYRSSERQTKALMLDLDMIVKAARHEAIERAKAEYGPDRRKNYQSRLKSSLRKRMSDLLQSSEHMKKLAPVFEAASFAGYVAARFIYHLRVVCDTAASMGGLDRFMRDMIAASDSALPAVVILVQFVSSIRRPLRYGLYGSLEGVPLLASDYYVRGEVSWFAKEVFVYSQLLRRISIARWQRTVFEIIEESMCMDHDGQAVMAPLQLLTLINTPNKDLVQHAVTLSRSTLKAVNWNSYPGELMFLACKYHSDKVVALLLNHAFFLESIYTTSRKLLLAQDKLGSLPIHVATENDYFRIIEELLKAEERDARSLSEESHASGRDGIASDDDHTRLLYVPHGSGQLPIHLAVQRTRPRDGERTFDLMIRYDAKYATLFPATLSNQPGALDSTRKQPSMLLARNWLGFLPIHLAASGGNAPGVQAMLQREFEAFCEYMSLQSPRSSSQNNQQRSHLLFAHSPSRELPIESALYSWVLQQPPETQWKIVQTMLEFEVKWMNLSPIETPGLKRWSELLNSKVFSSIIVLWKDGLLKPEWLDWLLDRYEVHSSVEINTLLVQIRNRMETTTVARNPTDEFILLQKKDDYQMRRLEQLPPEPGSEVDAATV